MPSPLIRILLVAENIRLTRALTDQFKESPTPNEISILNDPVEALTFLKGHGKSSDEPTGLVCLEIDILGGSLQLLEDLRVSPLTRVIPVLAFGKRSRTRLCSLLYEGMANCFLVIPDDESELKKMIALVDKFWLSCVVLPFNGI
jgi:hypothetical protein